MKRSRIGVLAVVLVITLVLIPCLQGQVKKDQRSGLDRLEGTIQSIDQSTSTITIRQTGKVMTWKVVFSKDTQFTFRNAAATVDELKVERRAICLGKIGKDSVLSASRIDMREK
jgi:hypothetical protein